MWIIAGIKNTENVQICFFSDKYKIVTSNLERLGPPKVAKSFVNL